MYLRMKFDSGIGQTCYCLECSLTESDMEKVDFRPQAKFWGWKMSTSLNSSYGIKKCLEMHLFPLKQIFSLKNGLIVANNADLWTLRGKNCKKINRLVFQGPTGLNSFWRFFFEIFKGNPPLGP